MSDEIMLSENTRRLAVQIRSKTASSILEGIEIKQYFNMHAKNIMKAFIQSIQTPLKSV